MFYYQALTTGTVPNFIDLVLNLDSSAVKQDSIIHQARAANKRVIFYGDETWLKLFPNSFVRHDGTTSFYISDYTEVILFSVVHVLDKYKYYTK